MKTIYYGRISTTDGQTAASQYDDAAKQGVHAKHVHIEEGVSGAPRRSIITIIAAGMAPTNILAGKQPQ